MGTTSPGQLRIAEKLHELVLCHGCVVTELVETGRLPFKQIDNFYGRHLDRQRAIVAAMSLGASYSRAYRESAGCFDTKRWSKVPSRVASCRGLVLRSVEVMASLSHALDTDLDDIGKAEVLAEDIASEAQKLIRQMPSMRQLMRP